MSSNTHQEKNYDLGNKIRNFRLRAGLSQFKLEELIDASPGSVSRIENGEVNPTKETLVKIIEVLNIKSKDAALLFNLDLDELPKMIKLAGKLSSTLELDKLLQSCVNELVYELDFLGSMIFLTEEETVYAKTITQSWYTQLVLKILGQPVSSLSTSMQINKENYIVRTIKENKPFYGYRISDFSKNVIPDKLADLLQKVTVTKCGISLPVKYDGMVIGALFCTKGYDDDFKSEMNVLESFADLIGVAVVNSRKYEALLLEMNTLKIKNA